MPNSNSTQSAEESAMYIESDAITAAQEVRNNAECDYPTHRATFIKSVITTLQNHLAQVNHEELHRHQNSKRST